MDKLLFSPNIFFGLKLFWHCETFVTNKFEEVIFGFEVQNYTFLGS